MYIYYQIIVNNVEVNRQIGVSKNRQSDSYWYEGGEESSNYLMAAAVEQRTSEQQQEQRTMSIGQILKAFNSLEALVIFQRVTDSGINGIDNTLLAQSVLPHITRKQYYLRMTGLKQAGLISKSSGKYVLTSLGLVIRNSLRIIDKGMCIIQSINVSFSYCPGSFFKREDFFWLQHVYLMLLLYYYSS